jgi:chemotaxis protein methyltransferase CheR
VSPPLTRRDEEAFRDAVRDVLGLQFDDSRLEEVGAALRRRLAATKSDAASYLRRLRGARGHSEARALAELLAISETHFLRNSEQFRAFAEVALPERMRARGAHKLLRVLSAGCSSGEEPYSIAIVIGEAFPELAEAWDVRIVGVDVNPAVLERARAGRYGKWSLRETPEAVRGRWFRKAGAEFVLDDRIRRAVAFEERNLLDGDPAFWREAAFDVVFFRNVGMYFPADVMRAVTERIARALAPGGFLFLGHAETLRGVSQDFHLRHSHGCFYYQLRRAGEGRDAPSPVAAQPAPERARIVESAGSWAEAIGRAAERIAALEARSPAGQPAPAEPAPERAAAAASPGRWGVAAALELLRQERFSEAMAVVTALPSEARADPDARLLQAVLLTSCGQLERAEGICAQLLQRDDLDAGAHYLAALCREHAGDRHGAREHDEAAAYIDPGFAMPRLHLGLLARRAGDVEAARRELGRAEVLLQREDASRILLFGGGFGRDGLLALCRAELRACGGAP